MLDVSVSTSSMHCLARSDKSTAEVDVTSAVNTFVAHGLKR